MRRVLLSLGAATIASLMIFASPAGAGCPTGDGTIPGTPGKVTTVATPAGIFYVDDRDFADADGDEKADGLWVYEESNRRAGLQRGGDQWTLGMLPGTVPTVQPVPILPPNPGGLPVLPNGVVLCRNTCGGGSIADTAGFHDDCDEAKRLGVAPDKIWF